MGMGSEPRAPIAIREKERSLELTWARRQAGYLLKRRKFDRMLVANAIDLDWRANKTQFATLDEIFIKRFYSDFFPFYRNVRILDIGAHWGYFSIFADRNTGPGARITAVEPSSLNFERLSENIARSNATKVSPLCCAVAASSGSGELRLGHEVNNSLVLAPTTGVASERVETITLEGLIARSGGDRIDFLKMDCEGAEYQVFEATSDECLAKIDVVSMEFHDVKDAAHNGDFLYRRLSQAGFAIKMFSYSPTGLGLNYGRLIASRVH